MIDTTDTSEFERKKQLFTVLPLFIVPVLGFLFWGLGGGSGQAASPEVNGSSVGQVNVDLPGAMVDRESNKRDAYLQARREEDQREYDLSRDPYAEVLQDESGGANPTGPATGIGDWERRFSSRTGNLEEQLANFSAGAEKANSGGPSVSSSSTRSTSSYSSPTPSPSRARSSSNTPHANSQSPDFAAEDDQVAEIERAIAQLNSSGAVQGGYEQGLVPAAGPLYGEGSAEDAAMRSQDSVANEQLATLDRIMERATILQYPELAQDQLRKQSAENAKHLYPVAEAPSAAGDIKIFGAVPQRDSVPAGSAQVARRGGFFTDDSQDQDGFTKKTVRAQVHNTATVMDGSTVKLRLLEDVYVAGQRIPANTFVYGKGSLRGDRLNIAVSSITYRNNVYDVGLEVYDLDGQPGLTVPGSVERQIAKREMATAARSLGGGGMAGNGSLTSQLAAEGTDAIKEIASRKASVIKVELKAGHRVILRNE